MIDVINSMSSNPYYGTQALTMAIPLGVFIVVALWGFFQRRSSRGTEESPGRNPWHPRPAPRPGSAPAVPC